MTLPALPPRSLSRFEQVCDCYTLDWIEPLLNLQCTRLKCTTAERHIAIYGGKMLLIREGSCKLFFLFKIDSSYIVGGMDPFASSSGDILSSISSNAVGFIDD